MATWCIVGSVAAPPSASWPNWHGARRWAPIPLVSAPLRGWALQAAFYVHAPLPLDALDDLLDDAREVWSDTTIGDNALWILLNQLGLELVGDDGKPVEQRATADVLRTVRDWQRAHRGRLRWSADARRHLVVD